MERLAQLVEKMHVSRLTVAQQLHQIPARHPSGALGALLSSVFSKQLGMAISVVLALSVLFRARRSRQDFATSD